MTVVFLTESAGIPEGTVKNLPDSIAKAMIEKGICRPEVEPVKPAKPAKQPKK